MIISTLATPIPYFNVNLTKIGWILSYPDCVAYYQLLNDSDIKMYEGHYRVDEAIVQSWGTDDSVITDAIVAGAPWNVQL
jgi:hypothetical protein